MERGARTSEIASLGWTWKAWPNPIHWNAIRKVLDAKALPKVSMHDLRRA